MPTYKNVTEKDINGPVGVGLVKSGEVKTVADPVEFPGLERVDAQEASQVTGTEPASDQALAEAEHVAAAPQAPPAAPAAPAPQQPIQPAPAAPAPAPASNNVTPQGA